MILKIEAIILAVGALMFIFQHKMKSGMHKVASRLVYWTIILFISIAFNSIQFTKYPSSYTIETYLNSYFLQFLLLGIMVFLIVQLISPSKIIGRIKAFIKREKVVEEIDPKSKALREEQFEIFLETICWVGLVGTVVLEGGLSFISQTLFDEWSVVNTVCIISVINIPIILRQIIFYLVKIKEIRYENRMSERERRLYYKLNNKNNKL
ncbi:MAG: hypothetical protein ACRC2K_07225 [Clostridium sp.]